MDNEIRKEYQEETGRVWCDIDEVPTIEYVEWLEDKLSKEKNNANDN